MAPELDELDELFLATDHLPHEWRRELKEALERCALYAARIAKLEEENRELRQGWRQELEP